MYSQVYLDLCEIKNSKIVRMTLKKVALDKIHRALEAQMVPFAGYEMPMKYSSVIQEHKTVRSGVGVFDVSHMGEFLVQGAEAKSLIQKVSTNDVNKLYDGKAQYSCLTNENGGIIDDLLIYQFNEQEFMLVVNAANIEKDWKWINKHNNFKVELTDLSEKTSLLAVQGPKALEVCQRLTDLDLTQVKYYDFATTSFADVNDVIVSATGYTGSGGFELYFPNKYAEKIWEALFKAGKKNNIQPIGLGARDTLRLEMGLCLHGNDIDENTTPLEANLGWITKINTQFIGSDKLAKLKQEGIERKLVGFEMIDKGIPRKGYEIFSEQKEKIGVVTSGSQSPSLGVGIGLGYVDKKFSDPETKLLISIRNKFLTAEIIKLPFFRK